MYIVEIFVIFYMICCIVFVLSFDPDIGCLNTEYFNNQLRKIMLIFPIKEKNNPKSTI